MPVIVEEGKPKAISDILDVSGTDPVVLFTCRPEHVKFVIRKLYIYNQDSADHEVTIGAYDTTAPAWSKDKLVVNAAAGATVILGPDDLPADYVMTVKPAEAILAWAAKLDAAITANPVKVKAEFELM